jgi:hypothetical protein
LVGCAKTTPQSHLWYSNLGISLQVEDTFNHHFLFTYFLL